MLLFLRVSFASPIKHIVFFGDSLTDNGNLHAIISIMPKTPPYYVGRFSNGPVWSDKVSQYFLSKYAIPSANYAVGGATVELLNPFAGNLPYILSQEVDRYLFNNLFRNKDDTLFIIWIGANDYTGGRKDVEGATTTVVNKIMDTVTRIAKQGGKYFLILNLPDLSKIPYAKTIPFADNLRVLSSMHNLKLSKAIAAFEKAKPNLNIVYFDIANIFEDLHQNTEKYNQTYGKHFTNLIESCWKGGYTLHSHEEKNSLKAQLRKTLQLPIIKPQQIIDRTARHLFKDTAMLTVYEVGQMAAAGITPCDHPNEYLFWDKVHPTTDVHDIVGQLVIKTVIALTQ